VKKFDVKLKPWTYAYRLFGDRVQGLMPHFQELKTQMRTGGVNIALPAYLSFMLLMSIVAFAIPMVLLPFFLPLVLHTELLSIQNFAFSLMFAAIAALVTFLMMYMYPGIKSNNRKGPIEKNLPYTVSFLTLLSGSNVPPRKILGTIVTIPTLQEVRQDFSNIIRDVELFGQDLLTSIVSNLKYIPSKRLQDTLSGYVAMIRTGGSPTEYLRHTTENIMKERLVKLDLMLESLSALAEIYIMVLVAMPLLFVVLFATLGMLGSVGTMDPSLMLYLLTYLGIPIMASTLIVIIDSYTSR
jgi:flagellar protein FlaJ